MTIYAEVPRIVHEIDFIYETSLAQGCEGRAVDSQLAIAWQSLPYVVERQPPPLSRLRQLAQQSPPPQEWFDADEELF